jgi:hypothetical protein
LVSDGVPSDTGAFRTGFAAGLHVAGYRLENEIGRGTAALVYRARDERLGRLVALKILSPDLADDEAFRQRFIAELRAITAIRNPHIVPVFEAGRSDGMLYLAMRYVPGGDARSLARREGPLPPGRVAAIVWQAASALDTMHAAGLLHRDVKPANILVDVPPGRQRDWVYLSDFALRPGAAATDGPGRPWLNTLACVAPELIEGRPADGRADQYGLAASAFELLAGWPPFRPGDAAALLHAHRTEPPPRLTSSRPDLPPAADAVLAKALAEPPEQRYASCRELAAALAGALGLRPPPPRVVRAAAPVSDPPPGQVYLSMPAEADAPAAPAEPVPAGPVPEAAAPAAPAPAPAGRSGEPGLVRRQPWRPRLALGVTALGVVAALAAATVAVVATGVLRSPAAQPPPRLPGFPVAARSALAPVSGDVWVMYQGAGTADAEVYGEVKDAARGDVARLYAQPFPYAARPAAVASVVLRPKGRLAPYAFRVDPAVATRYRVSVFPGRRGRTPLASSPAATVYVTPSVSRGTATACTRPTCHEAFTLHVSVPPSAIGSEMSKTWYTYFGLTLSRSPAKPAGPPVLQLGAGSAHVGAPRQVSADAYAVTVTFTFSIGKKGGYTWLWTACVPGSEAADGVGLPGSHGCGARTVPAAHSYLG